MTKGQTAEKKLMTLAAAQAKASGIRLMNWEPSDGSPLDLHALPVYEVGKIARTTCTKKACPHTGKARTAKLLLCWRGSVSLAALAMTDAQTAAYVMSDWEHPDKLSGKNKYASIYGLCPCSFFRRYMDKLHFTLAYPLDVRVHVSATRKHTKGKRVLAWKAGYVAWVIAQEYVRIYRQYKKHGVWGHVLSDLYLEHLNVYADGTVQVGIGS